MQARGCSTARLLSVCRPTHACLCAHPPCLQGEELEPARAKAEQMGVKQIFIDDLREEFVRDYVFPMFRANSVYEGVYLLGTSIARCGAARRCAGAGPRRSVCRVARRPARDRSTSVPLTSCRRTRCCCCLLLPGQAADCQAPD